MSALTASSATEAALAPPVAACAHCGLPVPRGLLREGVGQQFCCHACDTAYHAIRAAGLDRYYDYLRADSAVRGTPARASGARYEEYDDPAFARLHCIDRPDGLRSATLLLEGLHCAACIWLLERVPTVVPGVAEARVDFGRAQIRLLYDAAVVPLSAIARFIDRLGYASHPLRERAAQEARRREDRAALVRIGIAGALLGNTMLIAFALYGGMFTGMEGHFSAFFRAASAALGALSVLWPGSVFFRGAIASLRMRTLHMDVPIALALAVGLVHGVVNTIRNSGEVYFDTLATLVFLLLIGRFIQQRQQRRAADAVELLFSLAPTSAVRLEDGVPRTVPIDALQIGDIVEVPAGGSVPVDGVVAEGRSTVNIALLTGESRPVEIGPGGRAAAGAVNLASPIRLRVEATGRATRVGQLMELVSEHARRRAPLVRLADRISAWFVLVVLTIAAMTLLAWLWIDAGAAIEHTVSLLIITCPCALGLATPMAIVVAIGRAARRGILVKGGETLEALASRGTIVFDKTGTLTRGELRLVSYIGPEHLKPLIAAAERSCNHPIARALARDLPGHRGGDATITHTLGGGIRATIDSTELLIGSPRFVASEVGGCLTLSVELRRALDSAAEAGQTPVLIAENGIPAAVAVLADEPRPESAGAIRELRAAGWNPMLLSGDDPRIARAVGASLGMNEANIRGGAAPEEKVEIVRGLSSRGRVVMVGDGVNDAAALAAATVGIAVQGGAEAALAAADAYLINPGLSPLVELVRGARLTTRAIKRNLLASLLYNLLFGGLAVCGLVNPLVAAVLMPLSGLTVVILSFRTGAFRKATP